MPTLLCETIKDCWKRRNSETAYRLPIGTMNRHYDYGWYSTMTRIPVFSSLADSIRNRLFCKDVAVKPQSVGIVISTYNNPPWLEKTLWGYLAQKYDKTPVELIIADDGSKESTRQLIEQYQIEFEKTKAWSVKHVWHPDAGFRKCEILNRAIWLAKSDYLIFTDHDCIPVPDNLATHYRHAQRGWFVSGGYIKLPMAPSQQLERSDIESGIVFSPNWLLQHGWSNSRFGVFKRLSAFLPPDWRNWLTTTSATWNGYGSSCWRDDALRVNGFNEEMRYGGLDREFGERLINAGIRAKQCRYSLAYLHLDHARPYEMPDIWQKNNAIRQHVRKEKIIQTPLGIRQHLTDWEESER